MGSEMIIPPLFRCPISLDLFKDPVTLCTGQTYDRSCIQKWLSAGNVTCPVTMQKLDDISMVPNHTLRHLIHNWLRSNIQVDSITSCLDATQSRFSIARIKLDSDESTLEDKLQALEMIHSLSHDLPLNNHDLIKLDFFGLMLELVFQKALSKARLVLVEKALLCALKLMPFSEVGSLNILKQESSYALFLLLFEQGNMLIKKSLCLIVEAISSRPETKELCERLGKSVEIVHLIVDIIQDKSDAVEASGVAALSALSLTESNRENMTRHGALEGLVAYLYVKKGSSAAMAMALCAIENLLSVSCAKEMILNHPWGVKAVVKMVFRVSDHQGSESAVNSLLTICSDSESAREKAVVEGVLTQLLLLLQSQCNARTKTKARMLLKLLTSMSNAL